MRWGKTAAAAAAIGCGVLIGSMLTTFANSIPPAGQPGSSEDPVVTKSYVDEQIQRALSGKPVGQPSEGGGAGSDSAGSVPFTVVVLKPGQTLLGGMGTEFIVRTGKATIVSNTENGIPDLTQGADLKNGTQAPNNHLLMIPREGRGLKVDAGAKGDVYVTVKGSYLHIGADGNQLPATP
ncbi:hypothetical protein [Paenibacillus alkalitolerans]|uniref:hypothetical protein n=1 Tax=Paenibacillus alkalitolerans TaxID=2799335 RepID=UPI0018F5EFBD|nr:hypothetical protein [Paenibacillus alkalitolerans]